MSISEHIEDMNACRIQMAPIAEKRILQLLPEWDVEIAWHYEQVEGQEKSAAWANPRWEYLEGSIHFSLPCLTNLSPEARERIIVHEIVHFLVAEMHEWEHPKHAMKHEERVVSTITDKLMRMTWQTNLAQ